MRPTIKAALAVVVLTMSLAGPVVAGPHEDALAALARGDYATALLLWRPLAAQGNALAQFDLGFMYVTGTPLPDWAYTA